MSLKQVKLRLDEEVSKRNNSSEISHDKPDPLLVAKKYNDEYIALVCALFSYGNAAKIVEFLESLDFSLLERDTQHITQALSSHYYRFQKSQDIIDFFIALRALKQERSLESLFLEGYLANRSVLEGVHSIQKALYKFSNSNTHGFKFLIGEPDSKGPYKRWMMYLRWMVRCDALDLGLWNQVDRADLLLPLDTHTFKVGQVLGLLKRKSYDLKAVLEITKTLQGFDKHDPVKYDFALYRIGQEKIL